MSQIHYRHDNFRVMTGWEQIIGGFFFLLIEDDDLEDDDEGVVFDNNWLGLEGFKMSVSDIERTLKRFNIPFPDKIRSRLYFHQGVNMGNHSEEYRTCSKCLLFYEMNENCYCID
jgi:hypothetical protein